MKKEVAGEEDGEKESE